MKKTNGFGLLGVILIMIVTAIVSSIATGVIMLNSNSVAVKYSLGINGDKELQDFLAVYNTIVDKYYDEIDVSGMLNAAEEGMLNFLGDKYTTFLEDSEYNSLINELSDTYRGIGIGIRNNIISLVIANSPAEEAGIKVDDIIVKINDKMVENLTQDEISDLIKSSKDEVSMVIARDDQELNFLIEIADITNNSVYTRIIDNTSIGYMQITRFSENLTSHVNDAIKKLEEHEITSLIIDVRNNVGGYLTEASGVLELFLKKDKIMYSLQTTNNKYIYKDTTKENRNYPIIVLVNETSASASEILAAGLKDSYGATLVGTKTYGKGKVQQIVGTSAKYTFATWLTPKDKCIDGIGIVPDFVVYNDTSGYGVIDHQLNKAIEILSQK